MPLVSEHFKDNDRLQKCLVEDRYHVLHGDRGEHVALIQAALIRLGEGVVSASELDADFYGHSTANAVLGYKQRYNIINPKYQTKADNIVGKMTIKKLDDDMAFLEMKADRASEYVSVDYRGEPHDHSQCPKFTGGNEWAPDKTISHFLTPINPIAFGRMINVGGQGETNYMGFVDCMPDPACDKDVLPVWVEGRLLTSSITTGTVSDVCFRSTPLDKWMQTEIRRICMIGARITFASGSLYSSSTGTMNPAVEAIKKFARVIEYGDVDDSDGQSRQYIVAEVFSVDHTLPVCKGLRSK
jgi:hypothetical protein